MEIQTIFVPRSWSFYLIFTRTYLPVQNLGDRHPILIELACHLVHVLCDFKRLHDIKNLNSCVSWACHGSTSCWCLYFTFLVKVVPLNQSVTNKSSICKKYRHKFIWINNTQLTTFYCYSATISRTKLSNK